MRIQHARVRLAISTDISGFSVTAPPRYHVGEKPTVSIRFSLNSRLTRDGTAEPVSRDQILRRERGQGNISLPCSADHEQDWQPYRHTLAIGVTILYT